LRKVTYITLVILALGFLAVILVGGWLVAPANRAVGNPPNVIEAESVKVASSNGHKVAGWFVRGDADKPGVLLLHSVRSNRTEMLGRALFLRKSGYSLLLIDMQGHGETYGDLITFGYRESNDVRGAVEYLREKVAPQPVAIIGVSMGGAASLLGEEPAVADAVVLEAVYSSIDNAIRNRVSIRLGALGRYLSPLLTWQIEPRLGISRESLSPVRAIRRLEAPVMIIGGTRDRHTDIAETRRLFEAARSQKELWLIEGAKHENLHRYAGRDYEARVLRFLRKHLQKPEN